VVNFPIPENLPGKLIISITSQQAYELSNGDYLVVDINYTKGEEYISFSFDDSLPVFFDGEIKKHGGEYHIILDECFSSLDSYLETIYDNIVEGYIIPNDLFLREEDE
jgi:hypothetical protein